MRKLCGTLAMMAGLMVASPPEAAAESLLARFEIGGPEFTNPLDSGYFIFTAGDDLNPIWPIGFWTVLLSEADNGSTFVASADTVGLYRYLDWDLIAGFMTDNEKDRMYRLFGFLHIESRHMGPGTIPGGSGFYEFEDEAFAGIEKDRFRSEVFVPKFGTATDLRGYEIDRLELTVHDWHNQIYTMDIYGVAVLPEPSSLAMVGPAGLGLLGLAGWRWQRGRRMLALS